MNTTLNLTGQATPSGNIPLMLYTPPKDQGADFKYPLICFLHGAGEGSPNSGALAGQHNATTVRTLEENGHGIFTLTKSTDLPIFTNPITAETARYYMLGTQQYYPPGTSYATGKIWPYTYTRTMLSWAKANLPDLDHSKIILTGLSLGGGGTWDALSQNDINRQIAFSVPICAGYGNGAGVSHLNIAKSGVPIWCGAAINDTATNPNGGELVTSQICRKINALHPIRSPWFEEFADGGHNIWYRFYNIGTGSYPASNGATYVHSPNIFERGLIFSRKGLYTVLYP